MRASIRSGFALLALGALSAGAALAAPASLAQRVATAQAQAVKKAAAKNWDGAVEVIGVARDDVRSVRRAALRPKSKADSPQYRAAKKDLQEWWKQQQPLVKAGQTTRERSTREFKKRVTALEQKYGLGKPVPPDTNVTKITAPYDLMLASLEDSLADVYGKKGELEAAATHRQTALEGRLRVYESQGDTTQANQAVEKLLTVMGDNPQSYTIAGTYFQEHRQFARAAQVWEKGIREVESGRAQPTGRIARGGRERVRIRLLAQFNRQAAFCYTKTGRSADAKKAIARASQLEAPKN